MVDSAFDLSKTFVHLGLGASAVPLPEFSWRPEYLRGYLRTFVSDRDEGRLVGIVPQTKDWTHWECHTAGEEVVVQLSGRSSITQEVGDERPAVALGPGEAVIVPRGVWHTTDVQEPGLVLIVTAGRRTEYRSRQRP